MNSIVTKVSELIGKTPLFKLVELPNGTQFLLKLENYNPTGSMKIRMAQSMVLAAEQTGELLPGGHIIESTSGNTGLGLSVIAAERGYTFTAVVDNHACQEKLLSMQAMGTQLHFVSGQETEGLATSIREDTAERMAAEDPLGWFPEQHNNFHNERGYYLLAQELLDDLRSEDPHAKIDMLICAVGTGGSLFGTGKALRNAGCPVAIVGVEPVGSVAFGGKGAPYYQSGTGTPEGATIGVAIDYDVLTEGIKVADKEAFATVRVLARRLGLMVGGSSGGAIYAALHKLSQLPAGTTVVTIVCDGGEKYLDSVFDDRWMSERNLLDEEVEDYIAALLDDLGVINPRRHYHKTVSQ